MRPSLASASAIAHHAWPRFGEVVVAEQLECLVGERERDRVRARGGGEPCLHGAQVAEVARGGAGAEELLCLLQLVVRLVGVAAGQDQDARAEQVRAGQVERVLGRLEQGDRAPRVVERLEPAPARLGKARLRPVEPHARVGIRALGHPRESVPHRGLRAGDVVLVGERVAEIGREADVCDGVVGLLVGEPLEAGAEQRDGLVRLSVHRVRAAERREQVGLRRRRGVDARERALEQLDRRGDRRRRGRRRGRGSSRRAPRRRGRRPGRPPRRSARRARSTPVASSESRRTSSAAASLSSRSSVGSTSEPVSR